MAGETAKRLADITDEGLFERLATAILREADPRYASLTHPGLNAEGKTVKAPLDGITFVADADPPHLVAVHHTTTKTAGLAGKWLHDPQTVTPRKRNKPTAPPGDIVKTAEIVASERERTPALKAMLALTTTHEPSQELVRNARALGDRHRIEIDIWSRSRLAHFLDSPRGQWLRRSYLGIEQEHLSPDLLSHLSHESLKLFRPPGDAPEAWVERSIDLTLAQAKGDTIFLVADAGLGKSVASYKVLSRHVQRGGYGLILPHDLVEKSLTASQAIDLALRQLHPHLTPDAGADALLRVSSTLPFLIVIEDINRSGQPSELLERIVRWGQGEKTDGALWRVICPTWPQSLLSLKDQSRKRIDDLSIVCSSMTPSEGRAAVQQRAALQSLPMSAMDADTIAEALGYDPLFIALHDIREKPNAQNVIARFIDSAIGRRVAAHSEFTAADYRMALHSLAQEMLSRRILDPNWTDVVSWFGANGATTLLLRPLVAQGEIIRMPSGSDRLAFRHDRVRNALLITALAVQIREGRLAVDILSDPYFAEMLGNVAIQSDAPSALLADLERVNPLALFYALRQAPQPENPHHAAIVVTLHRWLKSPSGQAPCCQHLRWYALRVLSQTDSPAVNGIVAEFEEEGWDAWAARFRNGDLAGGIALSLRLDPGTGDPWRDLLMEHVKLRFGHDLVSAIDRKLRDAELSKNVRVALLRLTCYIADPALAGAIMESWNCDLDREDALAEYLMAAAYCCGDGAEQLLAPICDAWAALPSATENNYPSPRDNLAAHSVRFAFRHWPPVSALKYFIQRAATEELRWPITYLLHEIDNPDSLEFVTRERATIQQRLAATGGISPFLISGADRWSRSEDDGGKPMSKASKDRLFGLWHPRDTDKHLREQAFRLWAATHADDDLIVLKRMPSDDPLWDKALFARLRRGDHTAIPALEDKLRGKDVFFGGKPGATYGPTV
jgi:hypothetical protein